MSKDVLDLLETDHRAVERLLDRFDETEVSERAAYFSEVVNTLVEHEVAEEVVVYPALRTTGPEGRDIADARIAEQAEAEKLLHEMESMEPRSGAFTARFKKLRQAVLDHASAEEATAFPSLRAGTRVEQRRELGDRYERAKRSAPSHPHPNAPDKPPGNMVVGPILALFDTARDAAQRA